MGMTTTATWQQDGTSLLAQSSLRGGTTSSHNKRALTTLTTTNCNAIRLEEYEAELQLLYEYEVEFEAEGTRSLRGLEDAIAHALAQNLDSCDEFDQALYKVKATTRHTFSKTGT